MTGERRLRAVPDLAAAGDQDRRAVADLECRICGVPAPDGSCRVLARHEAHLRQLGRSEYGTIEPRRRVLRRCAAVLPVPLLDADAGMLLGWRAGLTAGGDTIRNYVTHVHELFEWAIGEGIREDNPAARLPVPPRRKRLPRPMPEADLMRALESADPQVRIWLVLAGWAGLRACEIAYLRRENILDQVTPPVLLIASDATKGTRERVVPLSSFALAELAACGLPASGYAFARRRGTGPNRPSRVSQACNACLHEAGIPGTLHTLRHRFLTAMWRATKDLRLVQELAGHVSPATTALYTKVDQAATVAAVETLGGPGPASQIPRERDSLA